jgi:hypothetical protein
MTAVIKSDSSMNNGHNQIDESSKANGFTLESNHNMNESKIVSSKLVEMMGLIMIHDKKK